MTSNIGDAGIRDPVTNVLRIFVAVMNSAEGNAIKNRCEGKRKSFQKEGGVGGKLGMFG